jgi:hypothetical protein
MLLVNPSMKEVLLVLKSSILFTEMPHLSKTKDLVLNYLSLVLKSLIYWLLMLEEVKLVFSEEPVSVKPS